MSGFYTSMQNSTVKGNIYETKQRPVATAGMCMELIHRQHQGSEDWLHAGLS